MSETQVSKSNHLLTFLGSLGAILIFVLILFIAYLPNRPEPVDAQVSADRQAKADEARAAGIKKLTSLEVVDADTAVSRIPIEDAMKVTVTAYKSGEGVFPVAVAEPVVQETTPAPASAEATTEEATPEPAVEEAAAE